MKNRIKAFTKETKRIFLKLCELYPETMELILLIALVLTVIGSKVIVREYKEYREYRYKKELKQGERTKFTLDA